MRAIRRIIVHCSATGPDVDISAADIDRWHRSRGWRGIGYHYVIRRSGQLEEGRDASIPGAHARGHNEDTLAICLVGGVDMDNNPDANFYSEQLRVLFQWIGRMRSEYGPLEVLGHRDLGAAKACPSFDVRHWLLTGVVRA